MKKYLALGFIAFALSSCNAAQPTPSTPFNVSGQWNMILTNESNSDASIALGMTMNDISGAINGTVYLPGQPNNQPYPFTAVRTPQNTATMNILYQTLNLSITGSFTSTNSFSGKFVALINGNNYGSGSAIMNR